MTTTTDNHPDEAVLTEYRQLKAEQGARIGFRDNLVRDTLVAVAGALAITHSGGNRDYLLLVPVVTWVLGWTYLANDNMISSIGRYVRENLPMMKWETDHPADVNRKSRKVIQLAVDLTAFCGSGLAALIAFWLAAPQSVLLLAASAAESAAVVVLGWQFAVYAGIWCWERRVLNG